MNFTFKRNAKGQFAKGSVGDNQFAKGNPPNKTSFKKGQHALEKHPSWKGGVQHNKNDCAYIAKGNAKRVRRPHDVWKQYHGESVPKGFVIWHKDGNKNNDNIDNLELINRGDLMRKNARNHS